MNFWLLALATFLLLEGALQTKTLLALGKKIEIRSESQNKFKARSENVPNGRPPFQSLPIRKIEFVPMSDFELRAYVTGPPCP
jgi:hypothetical protein